MPLDQTQIDRLPVYAQSELAKLSADLRYHKNRNKRVEEGDTNTRVIDHVDGHWHLSENSTVEFTDERGESIQVGVFDGTIYVRAVEGLTISPRAANEVTVTNRRHLS